MAGLDVINRVVLPYWPNSMSVYYETAEVETYAVVKANFNANFNVYSDISDAQRLWKIVSINELQCLVRYNVYLKVSILE